MYQTLVTFVTLWGLSMITGLSTAASISMTASLSMNLKTVYDHRLLPAQKFSRHAYLRLFLLYV
jgi:hypothetical protein